MTRTWINRLGLRRIYHGIIFWLFRSEICYVALLSLVTNTSFPRFQGSLRRHGPFVPRAWQWLPLPGRLLSAHPYWPPLLHAGLVLHLLSAQIGRDDNDATSSLSLCLLASNVILTLCICAVGGGRWWLRYHCQWDVGTLWRHATYRAHLHINAIMLLPPVYARRRRTSLTTVEC